jgi:hypothetical protein
MSASRGVLFAEPNYSDTGVWCELSPGIDPPNGRTSVVTSVS